MPYSSRAATSEVCPESVSPLRADMKLLTTRSAASAIRPAAMIQPPCSIASQPLSVRRPRSRDRCGSADRDVGALALQADQQSEQQRSRKFVNSSGAINRHHTILAPRAFDGGSHAGSGCGVRSKMRLTSAIGLPLVVLLVPGLRDPGPGTGARISPSPAPLRALAPADGALRSPVVAARDAGWRRTAAARAAVRRPATRRRAVGDPGRRAGAISLVSGPPCQRSAGIGASQAPCTRSTSQAASCGSADREGARDGCRWRRSSAACFKVLLEQPWDASFPFHAWLGAPVVPQAHLVGAIVGAAAGLPVRHGARFRHRRPE